MNTLRIAVPSTAPGGLSAKRSEHFGHCDLFTLIDIADGCVTATQIVDNIAHGAGGCMMPVQLLQENKVDTIVVSGMGARPMQKFAEAGIKVLFAPKNYSDDVESLVDGVVKNEFSTMLIKQACQGNGDCHH